MSLQKTPHSYSIADLDPQPADLGFSFVGTTGDDSQGGSSGGDFFDYSQGGNDTLSGFGDNDTFTMGAAFTPTDTIDGGTGTDTLVLHGDYHSAMQLLATSLTNVETIIFQKGFSYALSLNDANIAAGATLTVDAHTLSGTQTAFIHAGGETNGALNFIGGHGNDFAYGGKGNDAYYGGAGNDGFYGNEGNDFVTGGAGDDTATFIFFFDNNDTVYGGAGYDELFLTVFNGTSLALLPGTVLDIEEIALRPGVGGSTSTFLLTMDDTTVAAGKTLKVVGSDEGSTKFELTFDGSAEQDGSFDVTGADVNDFLIGGALGDKFHIEAGGIDSVFANGGNDTIFGGATFTAADLVDGSTGNDTLRLDGDYSTTTVFASGTITSVETIVFAAGHNYAFTFADGNVAAGKTLTLDTTGLGSGDTAVFDGSAETDGMFNLAGGAGADIFVGGARDDVVDGGAGNDTVVGFAGNDVIIGRGGADNMNGGLGADTLTGGSGADAVFANDAKQSTGLHHDVIVGFDFASDRGFAFNFQVTHVDATVASGELNAGSFNSDLSAAIGAAELKKLHAVLFTPDTGDLAGNVYLIVNANGPAGYQANKDYVFELTNATHLAQLDSGDFFTD